jgi:hypothetical protein
MSPITYRCPDSGLRVQSYARVKTADGDYEVVTCTICRGVHLIDARTGKVVSKENDARLSRTAAGDAR